MNQLPPLQGPDTAAKLKEWNEWVSSRPSVVQALAAKFPPWHYYEMPETGQIVTIEAYAENGTVRVLVVGDRISIPVIVQFGVFGVKPDSLRRWQPH